jgi:hypothetical protein
MRAGVRDVRGLTLARATGAGDVLSVHTPQGIRRGEKSGNPAMRDR